MTAQDRQWQGKTGGGSFGQKALLFALARIKVSVLYPVLYFVVPFYMLFGRKGRKAQMCYFRKHLGKTWMQAFWGTLRNHLLFGKVVLDKFALLAGNTGQFSIEVENNEAFLRAIERPEGCFVVSAHVGSFEMAAHCLRQDKKVLNPLVFAGETRQVMERRKRNLASSNINFISVRNDMSHLFEISNAVQNGEVVIVHCDRFWGSAKSFRTTFLGSEVDFPIGAFRMAAEFEVPVYAVFIMKGEGLSYHGYVKEFSVLRDEKSSVKRAEYIGKQSVEELETVVREYPEQWFNYFDFWKDYTETES